MLSEFGEPYGIEVDIMTTIIENLRILIKHKAIKYWLNSTNYIVNNECEVMYGRKARWRSETRRYTHDYTRSFVFEHVFWFVPRPAFMPRYKYYLQAFTEQIWSFWAISSMCICFLWYIVDRVLYSRTGFHELIIKFVSEFKLLTEQSYEYERESITQTVISILMMFLTFTWNQFYKTRFQYFLTGLNYQDSIDSVDDIVKHRMKLGVFLQALHILDDFPAGYVKKYGQICTGFQDCINRTAFHRDMATMRPMIIVKYERHQHLDENKRWLVKHILPHIFSMNSCAIFKAGHPLFFIIDRHLAYMIEGGLTEFLKSKYDSIPAEDMSSLETQKLNFDHIYAPVCLLSFGLAISFIVFLFEIWMKYLKSWYYNFISFSGKEQT
ncbi:hypothetical protein HHI36_015976 [Cryptolaemus montrouzieri]|uniref:Uncharacterized protein n=1 Tax=Cryptolaemus montrouzieri TaxID=559131 RepID=A0ABD2N8B9_9CUCU